MCCLTKERNKMNVKFTYIVEHPDDCGMCTFRVYEKLETLGEIFPLLFETEITEDMRADDVIRQYMDDNGMGDLEFTIFDYLDYRE